MNIGVLFGREIREIFQTSRLYVVPGIFVFFGLLSPVLAKMTPEILKSMSGTTGIEIVIPPATAIDSFLQLFKNLSQIGILAVILTMMGAVAEEKRRGTVILVVTKPASRTAVVLSKYLANVIVVVFATLAAYLVALAYTAILFPDAPVAQSAQATLLLLVYIVFIVGLTLAVSAVAHGQTVAGGLAILGFFLVSTLPVLERWLGPVAKYSPGTLTGHATAVLTGGAPLADATIPAAVALLLSLLLVLVGARLFERQEL